MTMKKLLLTCLLFTALHGAGQKFDIYEPEVAVKAKPNMPDSSLLPVTQDEVMFLSKALTIGDTVQGASSGRLFWRALRDPGSFDGRFKTTCFYSGEGSKPVLSLWTKSPNELIYAKGLFVQRFFCSYYGFSRPDTVDEWINDRIQFIPAVAETDPSVKKYGNTFKGTVRARLIQLQGLLVKREMECLFIEKGKYYSGQYTMLVVKTADRIAVQAILKKLGLPAISWDDFLKLKGKAKH